MKTVLILAAALIAFGATVGCSDPAPAASTEAPKDSGVGKDTKMPVGKGRMPPPPK